MSLYLTVAHYTASVTLACPETGVVNCAKVTASPESVLFGIFPVATLGLAFFVVMVALTTPWAWRVTWPALRWARLGGADRRDRVRVLPGLHRAVTLDAICLWCTSVHVITFLLFAMVVHAAAAAPERGGLSRRTRTGSAR